MCIYFYYYFIIFICFLYFIKYSSLSLISFAFIYILYHIKMLSQLLFILFHYIIFCPFIFKFLHLFPLPSVDTILLDLFFFQFKILSSCLVSSIHMFIIICSIGIYLCHLIPFFPFTIHFFLFFLLFFFPLNRSNLLLLT